MSAASDLRDRIRQRLVGSQTKRVFLVEGVDDKLALDILLNRFVLNWESAWVVEAAINKKELQEVLKLEPDWLGLVDRDEWDAAERDKRQQATPNLLVLPRFCMENYLVVPDEVWDAVPPARQNDVPKGLPGWQAQALKDLDQYVRHGVLWHVVTPLWSGLRGRGFKEKLASDSAACVAVAQSDADIQQVLSDWDAYLDSARLFSEFQSKLAEAQQLPPYEQLKHWVHGKTRWREVVNPAMNALFGQMAESVRRRKIFEHLPAWPNDLQFVLQRMGLQLKP
jgi:hypothetical protein